MEINFLILVDILSVAEDKNKLGKIQVTIPPIILKYHIDYLINDKFIEPSNIDTTDIYKSIGKLTPEGAKYLSAFRCDKVNDKIAEILKERNTNSFEVAYNLAVQMLSEYKK